MKINLDGDNLDFFHLDFYHLETLVHKLPNIQFIHGLYISQDSLKTSSSSTYYQPAAAAYPQHIQTSLKTLSVNNFDKY